MQNVKLNNPPTHKRQIDVSRGKLSMDAALILEDEIRR